MLMFMIVIVFAVIMIVLKVVFVVLGGCVQLLIRSLARRYLVCFRHFTRVQINAFQRRP
jgi:hypothetical protein